MGFALFMAAGAAFMGFALFIVVYGRCAAEIIEQSSQSSQSNIRVNRHNRTFESIEHSNQSKNRVNPKKALP
jgi:hypothetical protein